MVSTNVIKFLVMLTLSLVMIGFVYWAATRELGVHPFGFIMTRHVNSDTTMEYWLHACQCIRRVYGEDVPIVVVDDDSAPEYRKRMSKIHVPNCQIVYSEFPKRGELLAYYYLYKNRYFTKAVVIHDSVFIQRKIDFQDFQNVRFLWQANHNYDDVDSESSIVKIIDRDGEHMRHYMNKDAWPVCFGVMSAIDLSFLDKISYLFELIPHVKDRRDRMAIERIFSMVCTKNSRIPIQTPFFGSIFSFEGGWGYSYDRYKLEQPDYEVIKIWSGR